MPEAHRPSIKRRLLIGLLVTTLAAWGAALFFSYRDTRHELNELLDAYLAQSSSLLIAQLGAEVEEIDTEHVPTLHRYSRKVVFQVWEEGTHLRLHSAAAPNQHLSATLEGFSDARIGDEHWRVFSAWDAGHRYLVQVGERRGVRDELSRQIAEHLMQPLLLALPIFALIIWLVVSRGLRPLVVLREQVESRDTGNLSALAESAVPAEVVPLVRALNGLFARLATALDQERRFTADAAHELRTPLAAIKTQAQVALAAASDEARRNALDNVLAGCDRAARLVEQLLTLARLEPGQGVKREACDLRQLAASVLAETAQSAIAKGVEVQLLDGEAAVLQADPGLLRILMRNLIDNAIRYSPSGSEVRVDVGRLEGGTQFTVSDQGPGIPAEEKQQVWERFHRVLGTGETGSGLGLSIVKRIAELHGAQTELTEGDGGKGLRVIVTFSI